MNDGRPCGANGCVVAVMNVFPNILVEDKLTYVEDDFNILWSANTEMAKAIACTQSPETIKQIFKYQQSRVAKIEITESVNIQRKKMDHLKKAYWRVNQM